MRLSIAIATLSMLLRPAIACDDGASMKQSPGADADAHNTDSMGTGDPPGATAEMEDVPDAAPLDNADGDMPETEDSPHTKPDGSNAEHDGSSGTGGDPSSLDTAGGSRPASAADRTPTVSYVIASVGFDALFDAAISSGPIPAPVLLYSGGLASLNTTLAVKPIDIDYDIVEHPEAWPAWRRNTDSVELRDSAGWKPLYYKYECAPLVRGTTLTGTFQRLRDTAVGTTAAVKTIERYRFKSDGVFETCKSTLTVVPAIPTVNRKYERKAGKYTIDGYRIQFVYDDGSSAVAAFFYDPTRPTRAWLGRSHFPTPSSDVPEICAVP